MHCAIIKLIIYFLIAQKLVASTLYTFNKYLVNSMVSHSKHYILDVTSCFRSSVGDHNILQKLQLLKLKVGHSKTKSQQFFLIGGFKNSLGCWFFHRQSSQH